MYLLKNAVGLFVMFALLLVACEESRLEPVAKRERTYLRILNAFSEANDLDVDIQSFGERKRVANNLPFKTAWPKNGYASLLTTLIDNDSAGTISNFVIDFYNDPTGQTTLVPPYALNLVPEVKLSVCLVDSFGKPLVVRTLDDFQPPGPGKANIRFMNIDHSVRSASLVAKNDTVKIDRLNFLNFSTFKQFPAKTYTFYFVDDFTGRKLDSIPGLQINSGQTIRFFLAPQFGKPTGGYEILE